MPPGPAYSWFCVIYSAAQIIRHAARCREAQIPLTTPLKSHTRAKVPQDVTSSPPSETVETKGSLQFAKSSYGQVADFLGTNVVTEEQFGGDDKKVDQVRFLQLCYFLYQYTPLGIGELCYVARTCCITNRS